jgi:hypothetical protein
VQQFVSLAQTQRGDQAVDGLPDRVAPRPQAEVVNENETVVFMN